MLKDILGIIGARYLIAFLNLILIFINAKVLGIEGMGLIGLIWASVNIIVMVNGIFGGNTIVYFINKYAIRTILPIAYVWIFIGTGIGCGVMSLFNLLPGGYLADIYMLTVLYSSVIANSRFLLGKDNIKGFNLTNMLHGGLLFFILLYFYYITERKDVSAYIDGLYLTNVIALFVSLLMLIPYVAVNTNQNLLSQKKWPSILKEMFVYGLWGSADNIAEICTTRFNYFFVQRFGGLGSVGLLDVGTKISESVWNISRSIAYIEYNRIAKTGNSAEQKKITLQLFKLTFLAMAFVMSGILLIPEWIYIDYLFSEEFKGIRNVIAALSLGIIALGCNAILSHYFIGSGKIKYSAASSCIGLGTLLMAGYLLIPLYGVIGSVISTSIAFTAMLLFSIIIFIKQTGCSLRNFLPNREDWEYIRKYILKRKSVT
ncbi:MAG: polysaccharide biosynthesis C-terminal domain-containing protein [Tannerellaceae bacterium]|jgi:O-antigen/teichoic acid export membrane protein|nr:polysaccharide biosynthesis C-terminal domain-containing protein [Tannerellaceae bacterium]